MNGTILAHTDGNVPNLMVKIPKQDEFYLGELFYFFEFACGVSGYVLGVNPFNQPGVESYKKNMFALLGKPGYEEEREELLDETVRSRTARSDGRYAKATGRFRKRCVGGYRGIPLSNVRSGQRRRA